MSLCVWTTDACFSAADKLGNEGTEKGVVPVIWQSHFSEITSRPRPPTHPPSTRLNTPSLTKKTSHHHPFAILSLQSFDCPRCIPFQQQKGPKNALIRQQTSRTAKQLGCCKSTPFDTYKRGCRGRRTRSARHLHTWFAGHAAAHLRVVGANQDLALKRTFPSPVHRKQDL